MATISIILRTDKIKKDGSAPIHFLVTKDRKKLKISSGFCVLTKHWDSAKCKVKPSEPNSARLNHYLQEKVVELQEKILQQETSTKSLTVLQLKKKIFGAPPTCFIRFAENVNEGNKFTGQISTYYKNESIIKKLKAYVGEGKSISFSDIDVEFLITYERHLRVEHGNSTNTINKDLRYIRKLFNDAYRQDLIEHNTNPFLRYKLKLEKTSRTYLTEEELKRIEDLHYFPGTNIDNYRNMFVFSAYAGGVRISDILQLRWGNFDGTHINIKIKKTKTQKSIKLPTVALNIINSFKIGKPKPDHFIFPLLNNSIDMNNPEMVHKAISLASAHINKNLKKIAADAEINKTVSFHTSRHTWATRALLKGISIDKISDILGHAQIRETQIYAKIVSEERDKAMDVFNE